jgi:hypothetical protein
MPEEGKKGFFTLQRQLTLEPVMGFPKLDRQYTLITNAATGTADKPKGLGAILTQVNKEKKLLHDFVRIKTAEGSLENYSPLLLESTVAVWGM